MSKLMKLVCSLTLMLGLTLAISPVSAQESEANTIDFADAMEHVIQNAALNSEQTIAQVDQQENMPPLAQLAGEAVNLIAQASTQMPSLNTAAHMCPVLKRWSKGSCGMSNVLSGENALTDDQYEQMYQLKMKMKDEYGPMKLQYKSHKRHMKDMMMKEEIDTKAVKKMHEKMAALKKDMTAMKLDYKLQMAQVLTGAQRQALRMAMLKGKNKRCGKSMMRKWMMKRYMGK